MGLAGAKRRARIGHDPNNSSWTSSTSRYGHRLLTSAGWTPGTTLGAKDAAHSAHYTAGSEGHIRIAPCVEGKGLGAKKTTDDTFGLRVLSGLLGRLNGKDTSLIEQQLERKRGEGYVEQRGWGVHFVFGGYLVGDKVEKDRPAELSTLEERSSKKSKKRNHAMVDGDNEETNAKIKKSRRSRQSPVDEVALSIESNAADESTAASKAERRVAKAQRKEARRLKKEEKRRKRQQVPSDSSTAEDVEECRTRKAQPQVETPLATSTTTSGASTPLFTGGRGRHAMRHKYIDQKRMACMDEKALNEILMIKSNG